MKKPSNIKPKYKIFLVETKNKKRREMIKEKERNRQKKRIIKKKNGHKIEKKNDTGEEYQINISDQNKKKKKKQGQQSRQFKSKI